MWTKEDEAFMQHALDVAERGRGRVAPNPLVGCVLVKEGEIIAELHDEIQQELISEISPEELIISPPPVSILYIKVGA